MFMSLVHRRSLVTALVRGCLAAGAGWWLAACDDGAGRQGSPAAAEAAAVPLAHLQLPLPLRTPDDHIELRLKHSLGRVDVWVALDQPALAAEAARRVAQAGLDAGALPRSQRLRRHEASGHAPMAAVSPQERNQLDAVKAAVRSQRARIKAQQDELVARLPTLGALELGRVQVAHNAVAVSIDTIALPALQALPGVASVRPVLHYELAQGDSAPPPRTGSTDATDERAGFSGAGVTVAVLGGGVDYTHRNLGGPGTVAALFAAAGPQPGHVASTSVDGSFPTAKVIGGIDLIGETWGIVNGSQVGRLQSDPDPIDRSRAGHGTHVVDILAGASRDGSHQGAAPGAQVLAIKVCSAVSNACHGVAVLQGLDFALDPDGDGDLSDAADIIDVSFSRTYGQPEEDLSLALGQAARVGVVVVMPAGDGGDVAGAAASPQPGVITVAQTQAPSRSAPGGLALTSPRGPGPQRQRLTPELAAPGASLSALAGTGTGETPFSGGAAAAARVAGAAALVLQAQPQRTAMQVNAMLMNNAQAQVFTDAQDPPGAMAPVARVGAGQLRADRAVNAQVVAWNPNQASASVVFGYQAVARATGLREELRLQNLSGQTKELHLASNWSGSGDPARSGVTVSVVPRVISLAPGASATVTVLAALNPAHLPAWNVRGHDMKAAAAQLAMQEVDGAITVSDGGRTLSVPWTITPREASSVTLTAQRRLPAPVQLANEGAAPVVAEVFALTGTRAPTQVHDGKPAALPERGLRAVGVRVVGGVLQFGFTTFEQRTAGLYPGGFAVDVDVDRDGAPEFEIFNAEAGGFAGSGQSVVAVLDLRTRRVIPVMFHDAEMFSGNAILSVPLEALGLTADSIFGFTAIAYDNYFGSSTFESIGPMTVTAARPALRMGDDTTLVIAPNAKVTLDVRRVPGGSLASPSHQGMLLLYRGDAGRDADVLVAAAERR